MIYISVDQSSAAYIDGDEEDFSQAPKVRDEKYPGTSWKLPCDDLGYDKLQEGFHRLRESINQIPSSSTSSVDDDEMEQQQSMRNVSEI